MSLFLGAEGEMSQFLAPIFFSLKLEVDPDHLIAIFDLTKMPVALSLSFTLITPSRSIRLRIQCFEWLKHPNSVKAHPSTSGFRIAHMFESHDRWF